MPTSASRSDVAVLWRGPSIPFKCQPTSNAAASSRDTLCEDFIGLLSVCDSDLQVQRGSYVDSSTLYDGLKLSIKTKDLVLGKRVHALTAQSGQESNKFLANQLICMYASHGKVEEAMQVFSKVSAPSRQMWASIILLHARHGRALKAIQLYKRLKESNLKSDNHIFVAVLKACATALDLASGKEVHADISDAVDPGDVFVCNCLVDMYAKCGSLEDARRVFDSMPTKTVVTWNVMIAGYVQLGLGQEALILYADMQQEGIASPNAVAFVSLLRACASMGDLHHGKQLHSTIQERGLEAEVKIGSCLVDMYAKCGNLKDARCVFERLPMKDVVTWTAMIAGYVQHGRGQDALCLYARMQQEGTVLADAVAFVCLLKACTSIGDLLQGKQLHAQIRKRGLDGDLKVGSCLVDMYAKCGSLEDACRVFDNMQKRDVATWNAMISGYANCGNLEDARAVFENLPMKTVVSWTAIIAGYAQHGWGQEALGLYAEMQQAGITEANDVTFVCLLQACGSVGVGALRTGKLLHTQIQAKGLEGDVMIGCCLVDMYSKCGSLEDARKVFDNMPTRDLTASNAIISGYTKCGFLEDAHRVFEDLPLKDVVTWTALIAGYAQHGLCQEALQLYMRMQQEGLVLANEITYACLLQACTSVGALHQGIQLHAQIQQRGLEGDEVVCNCLVDMYAKCGRMEDARKVFDSLTKKSVVTWTALLNGYSEESDGRMAVQCFEEMRQQGVEPDEATFTCLLVACSHQGLVNEGEWYFKKMEDYGIVPTLHHYNCMVDLLGRSGRLNEAERMLQSMPFEDLVVGWTSLLSACKSHGDMECGRRCFSHIIAVEPENASAYVLLSTIYANAGRWREAQEIETLRKCAGVKKKPAKACIEVRNRVHEFIVGEGKAEVSAKLMSVGRQLKVEGGHVPHTELVLKAVPDGEKENALCGHAEKLALAYGLLNTADGTPLLVTKNLRMCNDCHSATKIMSRVEKREIVVRDAHRIHRFVEGSCSCGDRH